MKTGILGGTFDPIHLGHLICAETAYDAVGLDRVLLMPTGRSYFKADKKVTSPAERYAMTALAAEGNDHLAACDMETKRPGDTYTVITLEELHQQYPGDEFYYIVGADTLLQMRLWIRPQEIFRLSTILVAARNDEVNSQRLDTEMDLLRTQYQARIQKLPVRNIEISSTDIRLRVQEGRSIHYLVTDTVEQYIYQHHLYQ